MKEEKACSESAIFYHKHEGEVHNHHKLALKSLKVYQPLQTSGNIESC